MSNFSPQFQRYSIQFCGMFNFTPRQRAQLLKSAFYTRKIITDPKIRSIIAKQYYPGFRPYILNNCPDEEYLELASTNNVIFQTCQFFNYKREGQPVSSPFIQIQNVSLSFYNERFKTGVYSFEIRVVDGVGSELVVDHDELSAIVKFVREFDSQLLINGQTMTVSSLIEKKLLNLDGSGKHISISEKPGSVYHNGSKLKTWMIVDFPSFPVTNYAADNSLFELGTSSSYHSSITPGVFKPSESYYNSTMADKISVFDNWTALCLFDSFTLVGTNYLQDGELVWRDTYLKIYKFNLYCKFYLFKVNSDITTKGRLSITRSELLGFMNKYSMEMVSYNFLPNLIFENIKRKLGIHTEMVALMEKIENSRKIYQETSDRSINAVLSLIALSSVVSVIADFSGLVAKLYGRENPPMIDEQHNSWLALFIVFGLLIIIAARFIYRRIKL